MLAKVFVEKEIDLPTPNDECEWTHHYSEFERTYIELKYHQVQLFTIEQTYNNNFSIKLNTNSSFDIHELLDIAIESIKRLKEEDFSWQS